MPRGADGLGRYHGRGRSPGWSRVTPAASPAFFRRPVVGCAWPGHSLARPSAPETGLDSAPGPVRATTPGKRTPRGRSPLRSRCCRPSLRLPGGLLGRSTPSEVDVEAAVTPDGPWAVYIDLRIGQRRDIDATTPADRSPSGRGVCLRVRNGAGHDPRRRARRSRRSWPGSMECRRGVGTAVRVLPLPAHRLPRTRADANTPAAGASPGSRSGCSRVTRPPWSAFLLGRWWGAPRGIRGWEAIGPRDRVGFRPARGLRPREPEPPGGRNRLRVRRAEEVPTKRIILIVAAVGATASPSGASSGLATPATPIPAASR